MSAAALNLSTAEGLEQLARRLTDIECRIGQAQALVRAVVAMLDTSADHDAQEASLALRGVDSLLGDTSERVDLLGSATVDRDRMAKAVADALAANAKAVRS